MSYNYLPLDRKWLSFQQVKNLLDYDQLISITFDAHERILKSREYLDSHPKKQTDDSEQFQLDLIKKNAIGTGDTVPFAIVKLMVMLKVKSLSFGNCGVQIDIVKRLMELYNNNIFPVIHLQGASAATDSALCELSLPLIGFGDVYFKGQKRATAQVLQQLDWEPITLKAGEAAALTTGTHFITAHAMFALKKAEKLLQFADLIAALSFHVSGFYGNAFNSKMSFVSRQKGYSSAAATISKYLNGITKTQSLQEDGQQKPYSFIATPHLHGGAKDRFDFVLDIFLKEINSVTESDVIFSDEVVLLHTGGLNAQPLNAALDMLAISMSSVANISERRNNQLSRKNSGLSNYSSAATAIAAENNQLCYPASINYTSKNAIEDFITSKTTSAVKCLQLINNVEKVLALELLNAVNLCGTDADLSPALAHLTVAFKKHIAIKDENQLLSTELIKAIEFMSLYKL